MNVPPSISCYYFGRFGNLYPHNSLYNPRYPLQTPLKVSAHFVEGSHGCGQADPVRNVGVETSTPSKRCKRGNPFPLILNPPHLKKSQHPIADHIMGVFNVMGVGGLILGGGGDMGSLATDGQGLSLSLSAVP